MGGRPNAHVTAAGFLTAVAAACLLAAISSPPALAEGPSLVAPETTGTCPGYTTCPEILAKNTFASKDARGVLTNIANTEKSLINKLPTFGSLSQQDQKVLLGALILFDSNLSVQKNQTCDFCHTRTTGFTGGISVVNNVTVAYFGSQGTPHLDGSLTTGDRAGDRRPLTYAYSVFTPKLSVDKNNDLIGGMFWDMRATGFVTGDPAADQALGPYINPVEQGLPDAACVVRAISLAKYASQFQSFWGANSFAITWPSNTDTLCATADPTLRLALTGSDRSQATTSMQNAAKSVAAFERSGIVSPFSSKYDKVLCGTATFTATENRGMNLFLGRAKCSTCHTAVAPNPPATCGANPLFTNFRSVNIGVPKNPHIPFLTETVADTFGFVANSGPQPFIDRGVGAFLRTAGNPFPTLDPAKFDGKFRVPPVRNVTKLPRSGFVRAFGHNGEFKSIEDIVHFHNTRDTLATCPNSDPRQSGFGVSCWPVPEVTANLETTRVGNLRLTAGNETDLVNFLNALNDTTFAPFP
jgi:cytochrome c peroxidase